MKRLFLFRQRLLRPLAAIVLGATLASWAIIFTRTDLVRDILQPPVSIVTVIRSGWWNRIRRSRITFTSLVKTCARSLIHLQPCPHPLIFLSEDKTTISAVPPPPPFPPPPQLHPPPHPPPQPHGSLPLPVLSPLPSSPPTQSVNQRPTTSTSAWW